MFVFVYGVRNVIILFEFLQIEWCVSGLYDVQIDIVFCGVCYFDLYIVCLEWGGIKYLCVFGYEIVGYVMVIGSDVIVFQVGDIVGVGCLVDSCQYCGLCGEGFEQYCENGFIGMYNGVMVDVFGYMLGGYVQQIVVSDKFVFKIGYLAD